MHHVILDTFLIWDKLGNCGARDGGPVELAREHNIVLKHEL